MPSAEAPSRTFWASPPLTRQSLLKAKPVDSGCGTHSDVLACTIARMPRIQHPGNRVQAALMRRLLEWMLAGAIAHDLAEQGVALF